MFQKLKFSQFVFIFFFGFLLTFSQVKAVGVSPSIIGVNDLANGMTVQKEVSIIRGNPKEDNAYKVSLDGEGSKYIELSSEKIVLPKGSTQVSYSFKIKPIGAANGDYNVKLVFDGTTLDGDLKGGQNSVAMIAGITARIHFTITDHQVKKIEISNLYSDEAEVNQSLILHFHVKNLGNVDVKPDLIKVTLTDRSDPTQIFTDEVTGENIGIVGPSEDKIISVKLKPTIPKGNYMLKAEFYSDGQVIYNQEIAVSIFPEGTLAQKLDVISTQVSQEKIGVGESVRFTSLVKNSGEISLEPVFVVKVLKDGQQIEFLRSEKQLILKGEEATFSLNYRPEEVGNYTASSYFEYGVRKTEIKDLTFSVTKDESLKYAIIGGGILLFLIFLIVLLVSLIKRHNKKKAQALQSVIPAVPPIAPAAPVTPVIPVVPVAPVAPVVPMPNSPIQAPAQSISAEVNNEQTPPVDTISKSV